MCRLSMSICSLFLLLAAAIYAAGAVLARRGPDYRDEQQPSNGDVVTGPEEDREHIESAQMPLLTDPEDPERTRLHSEGV